MSSLSILRKTQSSSIQSPKKPNSTNNSCENADLTQTKPVEQQWYNCTAKPDEQGRQIFVNIVVDTT